MAMGWSEAHTQTSSAIVRCARGECDNAELTTKTATPRARSLLRVDSLDLGFHVVIGVGRLNVQQDGFIRQLHFTTQTQHQVQSSSLLDVVVRRCPVHRPLNLYPKFLHISHRETGLLRCCLYTERAFSVLLPALSRFKRRYCKFPLTKREKCQQQRISTCCALFFRYWKWVPPVWDCVCPWSSSLVDPRWHLLPGPVIGGQAYGLPPMSTAELEEKRILFDDKTGRVWPIAELSERAKYVHKGICLETLIAVFRGTEVNAIQTKAEFSYAISVMDKRGGWEDVIIACSLQCLSCPILLFLSVFKPFLFK